MKLYFRKTGEGKPLLILHGLFGSGDNWTTLSKEYVKAGFSCYLIDQRNHGRSSHSDSFSYRQMAEDIFELVNDEKLERVCLIGHSMGGKTAMFFAQAHPEKVNKLVVVDIAVGYSPPNQAEIFAALKSVDTSALTSRKEAEEQMRLLIHNEATLQFLLKNLYWDEHKRLAWRFNLQVLEKETEAIGEQVPVGPRITVPTLFLRGEKSGYISTEDEKDIRGLFSDVRIETIPGAGHWIHADKPAEFFRVTESFLK